MVRHPGNTNLILHNGMTFQGWPIQADKGPFIQQYLSRLQQTIQHAVSQYPRVFAFRVDLRFPMGTCLSSIDYTNASVGRFLDSFKAKVSHNRSQARRMNPYAHDSKVRYVWAREEGLHGKPHFHVAILLNRDAFTALGKFEIGRDNMFNRLVEAWASSLGLPVEAASGLVELPRNGCYHLNLDEQDALVEFFHRSSYLCKAATKVYGSGCHGFGASRT